jgi:hypothetical protein
MILKGPTHYIGETLMPSNKKLWRERDYPGRFHPHKHRHWAEIGWHYMGLGDWREVLNDLPTAEKFAAQATEFYGQEGQLLKPKFKAQQDAGGSVCVRRTA